MNIMLFQFIYVLTFLKTCHLNISINNNMCHLTIKILSSKCLKIKRGKEIFLIITFYSPRSALRNRFIEKHILRNGTERCALAYVPDLFGSSF